MTQPDPLISGIRIALRRLETADLETFQMYRNDPIVGEFQSWSRMTDHQASEFLQACETERLLSPGSWSQIAIATKDDNRLLGDIGIHLSDDEMTSEIGFTLAQANWGNGYATEAAELALRWIFQNTPATRVIGITDEKNTASSNVMLRIGMAFLKSYETEFNSQPCVESIYEINRIRFKSQNT